MGNLNRPISEPKNAESPPSSTASSKVMGMKAGGEWGGRLPTLMGKSTAFMKYIIP